MVQSKAMKHKSSMEILHSAKHFFYGTSLSRVTGVLRDMTLAYFFGSSPFIAMFMLAYRFAYLLRRLVGEASLQPTVIPHFESLRAESEKKAALFFRDLWGSLFVLMSIITIALETLLWTLKKSGTYSGDLLGLSQIFLVGLVFICLYALESAILMCQKKYFLPSFAPALYNVIWIAFIAFSALTETFALLAWGVVGALFVQWFIPFSKNLGYFKKYISSQEWKEIHVFSPEIRKLLKPISYVLLGIGAMQINSAIDGLFAQYADVSGPAYLWYAIRFQQLPIALFGISIAASLLPSLSRAVRADDTTEYFRLLRFSIKSAALLLIPATFALLCLGGTGINLVYGRGGFSSIATQETLLCLWGYTWGIFPMSLILLLSSGYYARKNYRYTARASAFSIAINVFCNGLFIFWWKWGASSVALATSLSALFQLWYLCRPFGGIFDRALSSFFVKITLVSAISGAITSFVSNKLFHQPTIFSWASGEIGVFSREISSQIFEFTILVSIYLATFAGGYLLARLPKKVWEKA